MQHNESTTPVAPQSGAKKLRFDDAVTASATSDTGAGSGLTVAMSGRSALMGSPTVNSPPLFTSSLRRPSEAAASSHSDVHVQLNPNAEVIHQDGSVTTLAAAAHAEAAADSVPAVEEPAGEVANFLADIGAGLNSAVSCSSLAVPSALTTSAASLNGSSAVVGNGSSTSESAPRSVTPDASERFRMLLLQLSSLILEHRPKDPEQYIVDYLNARLLSASAISRAPLNECSTRQQQQQVVADDNGAGTPTAEDASNGATHREQRPFSAAETTATFQPIGETVVERLASNALSTEVGHAVLLRIAELLLSTQPDDPEDFLWSRLEARSFGEETAHNVTMNADGFLLVRPEDPAQLALLKDIPASSPGYVVAVNLLPVLFAKKPADPISYLFYHIGNRARSSTAQSAHSSIRHFRINADDEDDFDAESCTSREFGEDSYSGAEDAAETVSVSESAIQLPLQRKGSLGSLFDSAAAAASASNTAGQALRRSAGDRSFRRRQAHGLSNSRGSSVRRSSTAPTVGSSRALKESYSSSVQDELSAFCSGTTKRVSIAQQEVQPPSPSHFSYDSSALPGAASGAGPTRSSRGPTSTAESHAFAGPQLASADTAHATDSALSKIEADEHARIHQEFELLRLREELRLERLQHEVRTLTRECEYRTRMAVLNKTDRMADRTAAAAREALEEAHLFRGFLCAQIDQLEAEQQRQLRLVSQQIARMTSPTPAGATILPPSAVKTWLGEDVALRQAEQRDAGGSTSSYGVPSELDILKKQVELLTMEQARAKHCGYPAAAYNNICSSTSQGRCRPTVVPSAQASSRSLYPVQ